MKLTDGFNLLATAPNGIKRLRELILSLAVQGKLVPQDPNDKPASELLKQIRAEKDRLIAEGKIKKDKPMPAISDDEKPFELPDGWEWVRFGELFPLEYGDALPADKRSNTGEYPVYGSNGVVGSHCSAFVNQQCIVVGRKGSAGALNLCLASGCVVTDVAYYCIPPDGINLQYAFKLFHTLGLDVLGKGIKPGLNRNEAYVLPVSIPPLAEQSRIVAKVEELMALCDALETRGKLESQQHTRLTTTLFDALAASESAHQLQENWARLASSFDLILDRPEAVDALEQTLLQLAVRGLLVEQDPNDQPASELLKQIRAEKDRLVAEGKIKKDKPLPAISDDEKPFELPRGWEWMRVGCAGVTQTGGTPSSNRTEYFDGNFPFIGPGQITLSGQVLPPEKFISELGRFESAVAEVGDVLMVCIGGSIGKCASVTYTTAFNQQINCIHPLLILSEYVLIAMSSLDFVDAVVRASTGSATPIISKGKWDLLLLPIPPLAEQFQIAARVRALRVLCTNLRQRLADSQKSQSHLAEILVESNNNVR